MPSIPKKVWTAIIALWFSSAAEDLDVSESEVYFAPLSHQDVYVSPGGRCKNVQLVRAASDAVGKIFLPRGSGTGFVLDCGSPWSCELFDEIAFWTSARYGQWLNASEAR